MIPLDTCHTRLSPLPPAWSHSDTDAKNPPDENGVHNLTLKLLEAHATRQTAQHYTERLGTLGGNLVSV